MQGKNQQLLKRRRKPRLLIKDKSYGIKDCALYKVSTKKRLELLLGKKVKDLVALASNQNYRVFFLEKDVNKKREIQAPKFDLDVVQTRIASLLLRVKQPSYVHSGIKKRSNVTNARVHIGEHHVLTLDIKRFYQSISKKSIYHFFYKTMSCSNDVSGILANLCSYNNHIPTGSRISMPLSYWTNHKMYQHIHNCCNQKNITMSVYVDDLTFSGERVNESFKRTIKHIIKSSGLIVHPEKTRLYKRDESKLITGVVVDSHGMSVRNKHHKEIYTLFNEVKYAKDDGNLEELQKELIGRLNAAGQIEDPFKKRAKSFSATLHNNMGQTTIS